VISAEERPSPTAAVWAVVNGLAAYWNLVAALDLGLFDQLATGPARPEDLAHRCGATARGTRAVLGGLVASGLVECRSGLFQIKSGLEDVLVGDRPGFMGDLVLHAPGRASNWPALGATARGGQPPEPVDDDEQFYRQLVDSTYQTQYRAAQAVAQQLGLPAASGAPRVLDLGAGAAPWTAAFLQAMPGATAAVNDLPGVIALAERRLTALGLADRVSLWPGDYDELILEPDSFDVVVLGHVCRGEQPRAAARLVARAGGALRRGGRLVVAEYLLDDDLAGPAHAQTIGVTMEANTRSGQVYTLSEVDSWLLAAGLGRARHLRPPPPTRALVSVKEGEV
jgi:SAM-dependent methyltransferase